MSLELSDKLRSVGGGIAPSDDVGDDLLGANPSGLTTSRCDKSPWLQGVILQLAFFRGITI
jgi:hypothetical protein